ncbi:hypothetical protein [Anaplasma capra]|uniref:hypothetical protein n=1 Tax=Anaplasma capra TaxID=1562740 RepID=UPI0021D5A4BA|nr:hypothetical protein [Anaplasma capra]MCU7612472.1 hypothetical protein [Anaplasma capra]
MDATQGASQTLEGLSSWADDGGASAGSSEADRAREAEEGGRDSLYAEGGAASMPVGQHEIVADTAAEGYGKTSARGEDKTRGVTPAAEPVGSDSQKKNTPVTTAVRTPVQSVAGNCGVVRGSHYLDHSIRAQDMECTLQSLQAETSG